VLNCVFIVLSQTRTLVTLMPLISILYAKRHKNSEPRISQPCAISLRSTNFQFLVNFETQQCIVKSSVTTRRHQFAATSTPLQSRFTTHALSSKKKHYFCNGVVSFRVIQCCSNTIPHTFQTSSNQTTTCSLYKPPTSKWTQFIQLSILFHFGYGLAKVSLSDGNFHLSIARFIQTFCTQG